MGIHDSDTNTPNKEFAPEGWHVPTYDEWTTLEQHLVDNGFNYDNSLAGNNIAKAMASTTGWFNSTEPGAPGNDQIGNNSSGFNAFPLGYLSAFEIDGVFVSFNGEGNNAIFWSSSASSEGEGTLSLWGRNLYSYISFLDANAIWLENGNSVSLVKD